MHGKQIMVTAPRQVELVPFELPTDDLRPSEVVVRTRASLLSGGTEGASFQGQGLPGREPRPYPRSTGYANIGEVVAVGGPAAFVRLATVPFTSIRTSFARAGDRAAVVGLGLIGNLGGQLLREAGMAVTGVDLVASRRELACRCGIETVADPREDGAVRPEHRLVLEAIHLRFVTVRSGRLHVRELITHRYAPAECQRAFEGAVDRKDEQLGVIFNWDA